MRSKPVVKIVLLAVLWLAGGLVAEAQIGNLMQRAKKSVSSKTENGDYEALEWTVAPG